KILVLLKKYLPKLKKITVKNSIFSCKRLKRYYSVKSDVNFASNYGDTALLLPVLDTKVFKETPLDDTINKILTAAVLSSL
ncbi:hypothetical protein, partial [Yersinia pestis]